MSGVLSVIAALIMIGIMIFVHELGHYTAGRIFGFGIESFSIGMGPALIKKEKNGILYSLRLLPIGGVCQFIGEDESDDGNKLAFNAHPAWQRAIVLAAGAFMNILMAIIIAIAVLMAYGEYMPCVYDFSDEVTIAKDAGLEYGDIIYGVNGKKLNYYDEITERIINADSAELTLNIMRGKERIDITMHDVYNEEYGYNAIGISMNVGRYKYGFFGATGRSFGYIWSMIKDIISFFGMLFKGNVSSGDVSGVVGTVSLVSEAVQISFETTLRIFMLLCANIGLMNLLPLPALDGGRLVFVFIEMLRGKPIKPEREGIVHFIGLILLLALTVLVTISDVRIFIFGG